MAHRKSRQACGEGRTLCLRAIHSAPAGNPPFITCPERSAKSFRRHGQAPYSDSPRSFGTAHGLLSIAPCRFDASFVAGFVANDPSQMYAIVPKRALVANPREGTSMRWKCRKRVLHLQIAAHGNGRTKETNRHTRHDQDDRDPRRHSPRKLKREKLQA